MGQVRLQVRVRRRQARWQTWWRHPARVAPLAVAGGQGLQHPGSQGEGAPEMKRASLLVLIVLAGWAPAQDMPLTQIIPAGEGWRPYSQTELSHIGGLTADAKGQVYVSEMASRRILRVE